MNLPLDFIANINKVPNCDHNKLLESLTLEPAISIRINPYKQNPTIDKQLEQVPWCNEGFYLKERPKFTLDPLFHSGTYYVQEASSMIVGHAFKHLFPETKNIRVLDSCAAPGGKSTQLSSLLDESSLLISNEINRNRAMILSENIQKWGLPNVVVTNAEPKLIGQIPGYFDAMIIDAPCSGEGMFRKDETAISEWSLSNVQMCAQRQKQIITDLWPSLKENGIIFYSTCTFNTTENEEIALWICEELGAESIKIDVDEAWGITSIDYEGIQSLRCYPHICKGEGFSLMVLRKTTENERFKIYGKGKSFFTNIPKANEIDFKKLINKEDYIFIQNNAGDIFTINTAFENEIAFIGNKIKIIHAGTAIAQLKGKDIIPLPAFAFSVILNKDTYYTENISKNEALEYFSKGVFLIPNAPKGWILLQYESNAMGFVKNLGNRINNPYPMEWRIRMDIHQ